MSLIIDHVTKKFGDFTAVNDISLKLEKGKMLGFLGEMVQVKQLHLE